MNRFSPIYRAQVDLLLRVLPYVAEETNLALKGGTAINMFLWDMPRLSVDVDLTYILFDDRDTALENISQAIIRIKEKISNAIPNIKLTTLARNSDLEEKLVCTLHGVQVKIEINTIMRGIIKPVMVLPVTATIRSEFGKFAEIKIISEGEIFGGKICAALDRQHPRDLFDVYHLFKRGGITEAVKDGFIVALLSHNHTMHAMLNPIFKDQRDTFLNKFKGMAMSPFTYEDFEMTRQVLVKEISAVLTDKDKKLLLSFKAGNPDWSLSNIANLKDLPAVKWKLLNTRKLSQENPKDHAMLLKKLEKVLIMD